MRTRLLRAAIIAGSVAAVMGWMPLHPAAQQAPPVLPTLPPETTIPPRTRLLVIAPHPDDEALGAAGLIARVRADGGTVQVVLLTSGDGFPEAVMAAGNIKNPRPSDYRDFGVVRERETRAAMTILGVAPERITFLGFPDEGLCLLASRYLYDKRRSFESPYTDRARPPATEQIIRGARYRGVDVRLEVERIVSDFAPTLIALPHPEDDHPDHCSTHIFVREALLAVRRLRTPDVRVLHYLVHYGQWPLDTGSTTSGLPPLGGDTASSTLQPPAGFPADEGRWVSLPLTSTEAAAKASAIASYRTQVQVIGPFMESFARMNELFLEGEPASLPECWCDGQNVATEVVPSRYRRRP